MPWLSHCSPSARIHLEQLSPLCFWQVLSSSNSFGEGTSPPSLTPRAFEQHKTHLEPRALGRRVAAPWEQGPGDPCGEPVEPHTGTVCSWSHIWHCPAQHDPTQHVPATPSQGNTGNIWQRELGTVRGHQLGWHSGQGNGCATGDTECV